MTQIIKPRKALNKAFLKSAPQRVEIELFKSNLIHLLDSINELESEEHHKNLVSQFLRETYYKKDFFINTKGRTDLVIHNGKDSGSSVGVLLETKKPTNNNEMVQVHNLNKKAFHELLLYYLRERITHKNIEIKHLVISDIYQWFIFDSAAFEKYFAKNKTLIKKFQDFEEKRLSGTDTSFFYKEIARPIIEDIQDEKSKEKD